ncbi:MAG: Methionine aminopeptidase 1 [Elusimicrobia bacterium ADurb.Bin231]|nr:MAG: Methionine aminopeptidase 1 [Elusimicrobia bacterium ADurb.Bin231]
MIFVKSEKEILGMRAANSAAARVLESVEKYILPGVTTKEIEIVAAKKMKDLGVKSACYGYYGYPGLICTSVNSVVVHGIPSELKLKKGDIISVDVSVIKEGFCGDVAKTYPVGEIVPSAQRLLDAALRALNAAVDICRSGIRVGDISNAIQSVAESRGFSVVRDFTGHGIGRKMHEDPFIPNYGLPGTGPRIPKNSCLAIEAMINQGGWEIQVLKDNWTAVVKDGTLSAHFEQTVLVGETGAEVLTV